MKSNDSNKRPGYSLKFLQYQCIKYESDTLLFKSHWKETFF